MGVFYTDCEIVHTRNPKRSAKVAHLLVDSGMSSPGSARAYRSNSASPWRRRTCRS